jgi:hypothetical protein
MSNIHLSAIFRKLVRYYFAAEILEECGVQGFVMDVGCGDGLGSDALAKSGFHVVGIDNSVQYANDHFGDSGRSIFLPSTIEDIKFKVDAVVAFDAFGSDKFKFFLFPVLAEMAKRVFIFSETYIPKETMIPEGTKFFYQTEDGLIYDRMPTKHPPINLIGVVIKP